MMKGMRGEPEACSALTLIPTLVLQTGKVKRKWFSSCWQQCWACPNHTSFQIPPRTEMNPSPFFFWMLKYPLHLCSCLLRILEDTENYLAGAKCPQMPFLSMGASSTRHPFKKGSLVMAGFSLFYVLSGILVGGIKSCKVMTFPSTPTPDVPYNPCIS